MIERYITFLYKKGKFTCADKQYITPKNRIANIPNNKKNSGIINIKSNKRMYIYIKNYLKYV